MKQYIKLSKSIIKILKIDKNIGFVYSYLSANSGNASGTCTATINQIALSTVGNTDKHKDKGICFKIQQAIKILTEHKLIKSDEDVFEEYNKKQCDYEKMYTYTVKNCTDRYLLIPFDEFGNLIKNYTIDTLNLYLFIIDKIERGKKTSCCYCNTITISDEINVSSKTLEKNIQALVNENYITYNRGNQQKSNHYYLVNDEFATTEHEQKIKQKAINKDKEIFGELPF